jgi:hypothetical protein
MKRYVVYAALVAAAVWFFLAREWLPFIAGATSGMFLAWAIESQEPLEIVTPAQGPWRDTAYLVAIINVRADPPHVFYVGVFSAKASDLTNTGDAHLDIMHATGETYADASERLLEAAKLYHPWVKPFLEKHE